MLSFVSWSSQLTSEYGCKNTKAKKNRPPPTHTQLVNAKTFHDRPQTEQKKAIMLIIVSINNKKRKIEVWVGSSVVICAFDLMRKIYNIDDSA